MFINYRYAGEIFGISNTFSTIPGMIASTLVNAMTPDVSSITDLLLTQVGQLLNS